MKLDGIAAFVAVAEAGSITEAARRLGLSKSVVSERLVELERALGARLLQRTTRRVSVTEDGLAFLERARRIVRETVDAAADLAERRGALVGPLRISAPVSFGILHLGPALYPFLDENPGIELTLDLEDRFVDVAADGYDAVIRHGAVQDNRLIVQTAGFEPAPPCGVSSLSGRAWHTRIAGGSGQPKRDPLHEPRSRLAIQWF